ncbi:disease resistance protein At4g27190-like [Pistacia vera]|uniref:disease resistance protein At4g27190-like n=1 Tax=Pistacia vera TaxID=55513 RepID=UPI0012639281|nr:disease resistance protein At4g27190-like [Pistacia vera]
MEFLSSITVEVGKCCFAAAGDQLGYLFRYNDNIENLKKQAEKLADRRRSMQLKIEVAERQGEIIFANVRSWIAEVDNISAKAESFLEDEDKANKRCLKGWCINLKQRYRFSKEAKKHTLMISEQLQEVGKFDESVSCPGPPFGIMSSSKLFSSSTFESRNSIKKQVMKALTDSDSVSIIGIWGMGGVGKTTLVKEIIQHVKEAKMYDVVVMAVVSQTPSIRKIQSNIADMLHVTNLPASSEIARASFLWERIKEKERILIILDDVWERIKLDEIGIPFGSDHRGCKILITSRSKTVSNQMECQEIHTVETLSKQESWILFSEIVGSNVETSDISSFARAIAAKCGGLPLAIVIIAGALKGKNKHVWRNAARQLQKSNPSDIPGVDGILFSSLELSLHYLEKVESKSLFLFCSLFPEDYKIPIEVLVRYAIGQRWFKDVDETIEDVRDRVHAIVSTITSSFLLIDDGEEYVKMHDVVRDFALNIAPKYNHQFLVKANIGVRQWTNIDTFEDFTCISLMSNNTMQLPNELECPKLQVLMLDGSSEILFPGNFFQGMKNLNVLDLSGFTLLSLPDSVSFLSNLRTLHISGGELGDIGVIGKLRKLEILSLSKSNIEEIPVSFSQLSNLRSLDLNNCGKLTLIPYGVIRSLKKLEELYINTFRQWEYESENLISNANLVELQVLSRLTHLEIFISNLNVSPKLLIFQNNLSKFKLRIEYGAYCDYRDYYLSESGSSRTMSLSQTNISEIQDWVKGLLKRTEYLILEEIVNLESISHNLVEEGLNELKYLDIRSCDEIKYLLNTMEWTPNSTFHNLEELVIYCSSNLVGLCHGQPLTQPPNHTIISPSLGNLTSMCINECPKLKNLFVPSIVKCLVKLKSLQIWDCSTIEEIVTNEKGEKEASIERIVFPSLYLLDLGCLDSLTCFSFGSYTIEYPALERLEILGCGNMKTFGYGEQVTPKLNKLLLDWVERWNGNLNATVQEYFNEQINPVRL